ncbi:MAG: type II toxin-antitoxin system HicB family antitoxin [Candidatus Bilamarchaeaceae archaeon]
MEKLKYHVVLEKQDEGGFTVYVPELPGCVSQGDDEAEAIVNIKEAIGLYVDELKFSNLQKLISRVKVIEPSATL